MTEFAPFYAQVFGIGLLWVTVHCFGMCGPIMASITAATGVHQSPDPTTRLWRAFKGVIAYQSGRGLVYMALGASAGLAGSAARGLIRDLTQTAGLVVAAVILAIGLIKLFSLRPPRALAGLRSRWSKRSARFTSKVLRILRHNGPRSGAAAMVLFGLALGFLPCMLMFWVLGIAATTQSAFHGAALMLLLVAMTTPVLVLAACGSSLPGIFRRLRSDRVIGGAMVLSGVWLMLIAFAANGWIDHVHIPFEFRDEPLVIMLW